MSYAKNEVVAIFDTDAKKLIEYEHPHHFHYPPHS